MSDLELCACCTFWKDIGDKMQISFSPLPSHKQGWSDGNHWLREIQEWSEHYEAENMVPAKTNNKLVFAHLDILFLNLSKGLNVMGKYVVSVIVGERLRNAMMLLDAPWFVNLAIEGILDVRIYTTRHIMLPRLDLMRKQYVSCHPEDDGRYNSVKYFHTLGTSSRQPKATNCNQCNVKLCEVVHKTTVCSRYHNIIYP